MNYYQKKNIEAHLKAAGSLVGTIVGFILLLIVVLTYPVELFLLVILVSGVWAIYMLYMVLYHEFGGK